MRRTLLTVRKCAHPLIAPTADAANQPSLGHGFSRLRDIGQGYTVSNLCATSCQAHAFLLAISATVLEQ